MPDFSPENFRFTDPRQARIHRRLALVGPGVAAFYRDACFLVASGVLATTTHLVAHLLREIESAIRSVALPGDFEFPEACPQCRNRPEVHKKQIQAILASYEFADTETVSDVWLKLAGQSGESLARSAHRDALGEPRRADDRFRKLWEEVESLLDVVLRKFERRFLDAMPVLDELLAKKTPGAEDAKTLRNKVPQNRVTLGYFFDRLETPAWLPLLRKQNFFAHPPAPERDDENGTIAFPPWPQSRFLVRMAKIDAVQELVLAITLEIPETDNVAVQQDLVDVAIALPPRLAVELVPTVKTWTASPYHLLPEKFATLAARLAEGGEADAALELAKALFAVLPDDRTVPRSAPEDEELRLPPQPRGHFETWHYRQGMKKVVPALVRAVGMKALELCSDLLSEALSLSSREGEAAKPEDYSSIWRPVIEPQGDRNAYGVRDALVSAVRDAAELAVKAAPATLPQIAEYLEGRGWNVFRRIALHLLRVHPEGGERLIAARLTDRTLFEASYYREFRREYRLLARAHFGKLRPEEQAVILGWIDAGPDLDDFTRRAVEATGNAPTAEEVERIADEWRLEYLAPIAGSLPAPWRAKYEELVRKHGSPTEIDLGLEVRGVWTGPTSSKSADELRTMTVEEIVAFLRSWVPERRFMAPSAEGLGRELAAVVAKDPERFAAEALRFETVDPTYVRALVSGLRQASAEKRSFPWQPLLQLAKWVVDQPAAPPRDEMAKTEDRDPGWTWTRQEIARLLASGFGQGETEVPFALRREAWDVLLPLTGDPSPTAVDEARRPDSTALEIAINTTRGEALDAVMRYAVWVRQNIIREASGNEVAFRGFADIPEAREVLDDHLDPTKDPARSMRAVYGRHLPWLVHLDREWVLARRDRLLPADPALAPYRDAVWDTYITAWRPITETFDALRDEYDAAVERIGRPAPKHGPPPDEALAQHLMVFYWTGRVPLTGGGSEILTRFFEKADDGLRAHAIEFMGRSLGETDGDIPADVRERFVALWNARLAAARESAPNKELTAFGWWFGSRKLDPDWAMTRLLEVLKACGGKIDPDFLVVEYLADQAGERPVAVMDGFILLVEGADEPWNILSWREHLERAIPAALASRNPAAAARAKDLVSLLAARGHLDFLSFRPADSDHKPCGRPSVEDRDVGR